MPSSLSKNKSTPRKSRKKTPTSAGRARSPVRKNSRYLSNIVAQSPASIEAYFETLTAEDTVQLFVGSYAWSLVNVLLDLKKSTAKRLFELVVHQKGGHRRTIIDIITLYHYKDYLTNPLPLTLESARGGEKLPNHYGILGVPRDVTHEELKTAQRLLLSSLGPDSFQPSDRKTGVEKLKEVHAAFEILKDSKRRKTLDESLPNVSYLYPRRDLSWLTSVNRFLN